MKSIKRAAVLCALAASAVAGTAAIGPVASAAPSAHPASAQGCTNSTFTVQWGVAGVYEYFGQYDTYSQIDTKKYGEVVSAPTGSEQGPYRRIHYRGMVNIFMKKDSLNYVRCD